MAKTTPATQALTRAKAAFTLATYEYDPDAQRVGLQAAEAMGVNPARVFKTLMIEVDGKPGCAILPSDQELTMKLAASALGGKAARMMAVTDAERRTGYKVGGVSPFGQRSRAPTVLDDSALGFVTIYVNGGQRGLQVCIAPAEILRVLGCTAAPLTR